MTSLFVIKGRDQGKRFLLDSAVLGMGRDLSNLIQLHDTEVSRQHAEIRLDSLGSGFIVVDLDSSNGTYVNNERIVRHHLLNGDRVQVGGTLMIFTSKERASPESLAEDVDIVSSTWEEDESRIVKSIGPSESSRLMNGIHSNQNTWLARARSNLQVMYRTALAVSHTMDIDQLLHRIMELIFEWVEADRGCVMLVDHDSGELTPKVFRQRPGKGTLDGTVGRMSISRTILDYVIQNEEGVLTTNARDDNRWDAAGSIVRMGVREAICVPLQGRYGTVGVVYIDTFTTPGKLLQEGTANRFNEEHLKLMVAIGHQAALAVEDTSYYSAMVQAERLAAIGQTIAGLSHHVKNILQGIRGGSYLIEEGLNSDEATLVRRGWRIVEKNQERISRLVLNMLTFSKERQPELTACDLNQLVTDTAELMHPRAADVGVTIRWDPDKTLPPITVDEDGINHAVLNVISNAVDACEGIENAEIRLSTKYNEPQETVQIVVEDNGAGIPDEELKKIFAFFESSKGNRGTGLGLSVSQKIIREHSGEIHVESQENQGSRFVLEIPAHLAELEMDSRTTK